MAALRRRRLKQKQKTNVKKNLKRRNPNRQDRQAKSSST